MFAQLVAPNKAAVSGGHHVFRAKDIDAANAFWQAIGGGTAPFGGRLNMVKFPRYPFGTRVELSEGLSAIK
jgi:hypothetical protein